MAGTREGGLKAKAKILEAYGSNFYRESGKKGGENGHSGGFAANPRLARIAGKKGGSTSRRIGSGVHKGSVKLSSLIQQCRQRYETMLILPTGSSTPIRVSLGYLETLRKEFNGSYTFDEAMEQHGLN